MTLAGHAQAAPAADHSTGTGGAPAAGAVAGPLANQTIYAPFVFNHNDSVSSDTATLIMQSDGNLVIYDEFGRARWASNTVGRGWTAQFQPDGNFVVYTRSNRPVWSSRTHRHPGSRLVVQDDGNVVIYDGSRAVWASRTEHR
ncbi:hypothetical protein ACFVIM_30110 [Streptomyces sp. NPDC057638]|uniref:hypothetical protein n=1 Tax=Streptomyces sp. NPDC057638 TaxID=3346190 RepID=UPI00369374F0